MTAGLYVTEAAAATLVALGGAACRFPEARRAASLVALHTGITLSPALVPPAGWLAKSLAVGAHGRFAPLALLPLLLVALVPGAALSEGAV